MKKIGLNLLYIIPNKVGGTQTYAEGIIDELNTNTRQLEIHLFCTKEYALILRHRITNKNIIVHQIHINNRHRVLRLLYENLFLPFVVAKLHISALHSLGYTAPLLIPCQNIVTIHDLNWYYQKASFSFVERVIWKVLVTLSAFFADRVITDSLASSHSLRDILHVPRNKVAVIYPGLTSYQPLSTSFLSSFPKISKPYILSVTSLLPHKNIYRLLEAFKDLRATHNIKLVLTGLGGKDQEKIQTYIEKSFLQSDVLLTGWVTNQELASLYTHAKAFVFPSLYEGFGFPVLEAFWYGTPVISSPAYALKEIIGSAAKVIEPTSTTSMQNAIAEVIDNVVLQKRLIQAGKKQSQKFRWEDTVNQLVDIYEA